MGPPLVATCLGQWLRAAEVPSPGADVGLSPAVWLLPPLSLCAAPALGPGTPHGPRGKVRGEDTPSPFSFLLRVTSSWTKGHLCDGPTLGLGDGRREPWRRGLVCSLSTGLSGRYSVASYRVFRCQNPFKNKVGPF